MRHSEGTDTKRKNVRGKHNFESARVFYTIFDDFYSYLDELAYLRIA